MPSRLAAAGWTGLLAALLAGCGGSATGAPRGSAVPAGVASGAGSAGGGAGDSATLTDAGARAAGVPPCPAGAARRGGVHLLPAAVLRCLAGGAAVNLRALPAQPLLLNLWGSWCAPCRTELPVLGAVARAHAGRLLVLGVDTLDTAHAAVAALRAAGVGYPSLVDPDGLFGPRRYPQGLPVTLFVGADGSVRSTHFGGFSSVAAVGRALTDAFGAGV